MGSIPAALPIGRETVPALLHPHFKLLSKLLFTWPFHRAEKKAEFTFKKRAMVMLQVLKEAHN